VLTRKREPGPLAASIVEMRSKLHAAHPNKSGLFDVKHDAGGMIDIEFVVQYLVLRFSNEFPSLTANLGNIALLKMAAGYGLIAAELAERCRNAYREFRRIQHALRLNGAQYARVPHERVRPETEAVKELWQAVLVTSAP
jgi:glutamate-ammonia-ligase adenylyltransferase